MDPFDPEMMLQRFMCFVNCLEATSPLRRAVTHLQTARKVADQQYSDMSLCMNPCYAMADSDERFMCFTACIE